MYNPKDPNKIRTSVKVDEKIAVPKVWLAVLGLACVGIILHLVLWLTMSASGMVIWPFIFAVSVLLLINDAADQNAAGVPPIQAYTYFFAALLGTFIFVRLVSATINPWLLILLVIGCAIYVVRDWKIRKQKQRVIDGRRVAGLCVRCATPVQGNDIEETCSNCGLTVNQERLDLFRLGRAISMRSDAQHSSTRQVLGGTKQTSSQAHMHKLLNKPASYRKGK